MRRAVRRPARGLPDPPGRARVRELGGVSAIAISAIAISHPRFSGSMIEWAHAFGAPACIHAADRQRVARTGDCPRFWDGDMLQIGAGLTLVNAGVHSTAAR